MNAMDFILVARDVNNLQRITAVFSDLKQALEFYTRKHMRVIESVSFPTDNSGYHNWFNLYFADLEESAPFAVLTMEQVNQELKTYG